MGAHRKIEQIRAEFDEYRATISKEFLAVIQRLQERIEALEKGKRE